MNETTLEQISDFTKHNIGLTISGETLETMSRRITKTELLDTFASKFIFGDTSFDEMQVWANHFGTKKDWTGSKPNADDSTVEEILKLDDSLKWDNVPLIGAGKIMGAKKGAPVYRIRKDKGGYEVGAVKLSEITDEYYSGFKNGRTKHSTIFFYLIFTVILSLLLLFLLLLLFSLYLKEIFHMQLSFLLFRHFS